MFLGMGGYGKILYVVSLSYSDTVGCGITMLCKAYIPTNIRYSMDNHKCETRCVDCYEREVKMLPFIAMKQLRDLGFKVQSPITEKIREHTK